MSKRGTSTRKRLSRGVGVLFETNAIHSLAHIDCDGWTQLQQLWEAHRCWTGWIPHALGELMGTNLAHKPALTLEWLRKLQRGARRLDALASGRILPGLDEMVYGEIYTMAGQSTPAAGPPEGSREWRRALEIFFRLSGPERVLVREREGRIEAELLGDDAGSYGITVTVPRGFTQRTVAKKLAMRERLGYRGREGEVQAEKLARDVVGMLPHDWFAVGERLKIPRDIVEAAARRDLERPWQSAFAFLMICTNTYHHIRVTGHKKRIRENDAADLSFTAYIPPDRILVTDDRPLRQVLARILKQGANVLTFSEFLETLRATEEC